MGRGLSDMQKFALRLAYENKQAGKRYTNGGYALPQVALWEFLAQWYKWPVRNTHYYGLHFRTSDIGEAQYQAGKAAAARMLTRLEERGLVLRTTKTGYGYGYGYELTEEGEQVARELIG